MPWVSWGDLASSWMPVATAITVWLRCGESNNMGVALGNSDLFSLFFQLIFSLPCVFILILRTEIITHLPCNNVVICHINTLPLYGNYGFIKWSTATMLAKNNYTFVPRILKCSQLPFFFIEKGEKNVPSWVRSQFGPMYAFIQYDLECHSLLFWLYSTAYQGLI